MNKLALTAAIFLILLGAAQWYLASNSLTHYLNQQIQEINVKFEDFDASIDSIAIAANKGIANVNSFSLNSRNTDIPKVKINNLHFDFDEKSIKSGIVDIKQLSIEQITISLDQNKHVAQTKSYISQLKQLLSSHSNIEEGLTNKQQIAANLKKITIKNIHIVFYQNNEPNVETIFTNESFEMTTSENGTEISVLMTKALINLLNNLLVKQEEIGQ